MWGNAQASGKALKLLDTVGGLGSIWRVDYLKTEDNEDPFS